MFESSQPSSEAVARFNESFGERLERRHPSTTPESAALVDRICAAAREQNRAAAAQLVAIGQLFALRLSRCRETEEWAVDTEEAVAAEVAAALRISRGLAGSRLRYARAMRERLPKLAEVFAAGDLDVRLFQTIVYRTDLITDAEVLAAVDAELAVKAPRWPSMTAARLAAQVDRVVGRADADAVRRRRPERQADRQVWITDFDSSISEVHGNLATPDARALDRALDALAATVCPHDPRTKQQRRADALGALAARADRLGCRCGRPDCAAGGRAASPVVIHVIAAQESLDGTAAVPGSLLEADGLISPELIAELAKSARLLPLVHPVDAPPEPGYRPSAALAAFIRCRDLTCRWVGCDHPAALCDIDHTVPYAQGGATHASNLKCYCRTHHLVKTFWGWQDRQLPDGTLILTSPAGRTYVTTPGSALLFPSLAHAFGATPSPEAEPPVDDCTDPAAMMPKRRRTRAQNRARAVAAERRQNQRARTAPQTGCGEPPGPAPPGGDDDPPPF